MRQGQLRILVLVLGQHRVQNVLQESILQHLMLHHVLIVVRERIIIKMVVHNKVMKKIHAHYGQIAALASTYLPTAQAAQTVFAAAVRLENIQRMLTKVHATRGQIA